MDPILLRSFRNRNALKRRVKCDGGGHLTALCLVSHDLAMTEAEYLEELRNKQVHQRDAKFEFTIHALYCRIRYNRISSRERSSERTWKGNCGK